MNPSSRTTSISSDFPSKSAAVAVWEPDRITNKFSISSNFSSKSFNDTSTSWPATVNFTDFTPSVPSISLTAAPIPVPLNASIEFIVLSSIVTVTSLPLTSTSNFELFATAFVNSPTRESIFTSFISNVTVNSVSSSVIYPSFRTTSTFSFLPSKSAAVPVWEPARTTNKFSISSNFSSKSSNDTSTSAPETDNFTDFTPSVASISLAAFAIPVPLNASIEFIVLSSRVTVTSLPSTSTSNFELFTIAFCIASITFSNVINFSGTLT